MYYEGEKYLVGWVRKSSREEGKGKGEREKERREKRQKGRQGKWEGEVGKREWKVREGLIFFPRERLDYGEENQVGKKGREKGKGREGLILFPMKR